MIEEGTREAYYLKRNPDLIERKVIEDIKAEIRKPLEDDNYLHSANARVQAIALMWCLQVIDKHISGKENTDAKETSRTESK